VIEERIYTFTATDSKAARKKSKALGKQNELAQDIENIDVKFEFVGILELLEMMDDTPESEVWYEIKDGTTKDGSLKHLLPKEKKLGAVGS